MRDLRIILAYDGTNYAGWQIQADDSTIQQSVQRAWTQVTGESIAIVASGRTDSGVHALGQACSAATESKLSGAILRRALNAYLPEDIRVLRIDEAPHRFHAIRDAIRKTYRYQLQYGPTANVLLRHHYWYLRRRLDLERMRFAAEHLKGTHDFASFQAIGGRRLSTIRTIHQLDLIQRHIDGYDELWFLISADGFLYNMVRIIVGSLVLIGLHRKPVDWMVQVLTARDRRAAGLTAPARGLVLLQVDYDF